MDLKKMSTISWGPSIYQFLKKLEWNEGEIAGESDAFMSTSHKAL